MVHYNIKTSPLKLKLGTEYTSIKIKNTTARAFEIRWMFDGENRLQTSKNDVHFWPPQILPSVSPNFLPAGWASPHGRKIIIFEPKSFQIWRAASIPGAPLAKLRVEIERSTKMNIRGL